MMHTDTIFALYRIFTIEKYLLADSSFFFVIFLADVGGKTNKSLPTSSVEFGLIVAIIQIVFFLLFRSKLHLLVMSHDSLYLRPFFPTFFYRHHLHLQWIRK